MIMNLELFSIGIIQGLILALLALGIMIPFRLLHFQDMTAEGSYPLGGVLAGVMIFHNFSLPFIFLSTSIVSGCLGIVTALLHRRLRMNSLLAGIILSTMIYSVNLRIMGQPNLALFDRALLFDDRVHVQIFTLCFTVLSLALPLFFFLQTTLGLHFRAVGLHHRFAERQGLSSERYQCLGLFLGNAICGLAGALMVQIQQYVDISMGFGVIIHALAALMIGEALIRPHSIQSQILAPFIGALVYQQIQGFSLGLGFAPSDLKFLTGTLILGILFFRRTSS